MADNDRAQEAAAETAELEALLESEGGASGPVPRKKGIRWGWVGGGGLLIALLFFADQYLFSPALETPPKEAQVIPPEAPPAETPLVAKAAPGKPGRIISLEPFFLPLTDKGKETGRFIRMTPSFLVSEDFNDQEMEITLPLIRKSIYNILERKEASEYRGDTNPIKETIKKEILTTANANLRKGSGSINDVYYEQFLIK
jgi:flagellar basal body-associated protein FliL